MPNLAFKKGIIHIGIIVLGLAALTALTSVAIKADPREIGRRLSWRITTASPSPSQQPSSATSSPPPQSSSTTTQAPTTSTTSTNNQSAISSNATCEITKPDFTQTSALSGGGISQVMRLKLGGIFTIRVTGVPPSDPRSASSRYYLSAISGASHWKTFIVVRGADGKATYTVGVFQADSNGTFTKETAVTDKYSYSSQIGPAPVGTNKDKLTESRYTIPLYRLYLLNTADNVMAHCGLVLIDPTAPGETIPLPPSGGNWGTGN